MTEKEKEDLKRRDVLRKLAGVVVAAPALKLIAACSDQATPQTTGLPPSAPPTTTTAPAMSAAGGGAAAKPPTSVTPPTMTAPMTPPPSVTPPASAMAGSGAAPVQTSMPMTPAPGAAGAGAPGGMMSMPAAMGVDIDSLACVVTPTMTEGPFFKDEKLERSDLLEGEMEKTVTSGAPLELRLGVYQVTGDKCMAIAGAQVDIWQADTQGVYSDEGGGGIQSTDARGKKFLRGYQITDEAGLVKFRTIVPGFYGSRALHIHFKVRMKGEANSAQVYTSQFFFDDALGDKVLADAAYKQGTRLKNRQDQVYTNTGPGCCPATNVPAGKVVGDQTVLDLKPDASGKGYVASYRIGVKMIT